MGFGGTYKKTNSQDQLTNLTNELAVQAGESRRQAAMAEASALRQQGDIALAEGEREAILRQRQGQIAAGNQAYQYISGGVLPIGSPLAVVNETNRLNAMEIESIRKRSQALQELYYTKGGITERGGMSDYLQALGSTAINSQQNKLSQEQQGSTMYRSLVRDILSGGLSIVRAFF